MVEKLRQRHRTRRLTLGADKGYDTEDFVGSMRKLNVTPHVTQNITERRGCLSVGRPGAFQRRPPAESPNSQFFITC